MYIVRIISFNANRVLSFGIEFTHEVNIVSSTTSTVPAGGVVVLTCQSMSSLPSQMTWVGPNGPVTSGNGVTVVTDEQISQSGLALHPVRVSHAGQYTCVSVVEEVGSLKEASILVAVQRKYIVGVDVSFVWIP